MVIIVRFICSALFSHGMNTEILEQIGLSRNEIKVYFALLELEQSSATPIVRKSGVPNSKVYPTLEKLIKKGLVSFVIKNNVKYFQASDPKHLINILSDKEKQIELQKTEIEELIPQIALKKSFGKNTQEATVYEGFEGMKTASNNIILSLQNDEEYCVFTLGDELKTPQLIRFFRDYHKKRIEKGIKTRLIANENLRGLFETQHNYQGMKTRFTKQELATGIFIYADKVMTVVWGEMPTAFVISSQNNAAQYRKFFEETWEKAKK